MNHMMSHLILGACVAFSFVALSATAAPMSEDSRRIPLPAKLPAAKAQPLPVKTLPAKTSSVSTSSTQALPKKEQGQPAKKSKKAASLPEKKPTQKVKITFDSSPSGDSSIVIVERDFGLSTNPSTNVRRKLLARPDFNYSSNGNVVDLPYEEEGQPLLQRIYDEETGPPPSPAAVTAPEINSPPVAPQKTSSPTVVTDRSSAPTAPSNTFDSKPFAEMKPISPSANRQPTPSEMATSKIEPMKENKFAQETLSPAEPRTSHRPSRFEMLTPPVAPTPQPEPQESAEQDQLEGNEASPTQALSTKISTATPAAQNQSRFSIGTGYQNTKYDRLASELKNGATTLNFALARSLGPWETSIQIDIAHGMDQSVTIANTRSLMVRAQGLRMFSATSTLKPLLGASAGLGDINVRSYRDDGSGKVTLREHASGMAFSISGIAGVRAEMGYEKNLISADLLLDATAITGSGEVSKLGGLGTRLMIGFGL